MKTAVAAALLTLAVPAQAAEDSGIWQACAIESVSVCTPAGCAARKPAISIYLSNYVARGVERAAYYRCAARFTACDKYGAVVRRVGDLAVFSVPEQSVFAKLGANGRVTDVAAVGDTVFISRGRCTNAAPPSTVRSR